MQFKNNGVGSSQAQAARTQLITDMTSAGVKAGTAKTDVDNYTTAVKNNGAGSSQAQAARQQLITDILNASSASNTGKTDITNLTTAIRNHGATSDAAKAARQQLISDLEATGMKASTATGLVDGLIGSLKGIPADKNVTIVMTGNGSYTISAGPQATPGGPSQLKPLPSTGGKGQSTPAAGGWLVSGGIPGRDSVPILAMPGELVVPTTWLIRSGRCCPGRFPGSLRVVSWRAATRVF